VEHSAAVVTTMVVMEEVCLATLYALEINMETQHVEESWPTQLWTRDSVYKRSLFEANMYLLDIIF